MTKKDDDTWDGTPLVTRTSTCYFLNEDFVTFLFKVVTSMLHAGIVNKHDGCQRLSCHVHCGA